MARALFVLACLIGGVALGAGAIAFAHYCMPDPGQQVQDGIDRAREACAKHLDRTPGEHRVCRLVAQ